MTVTDTTVRQLGIDTDVLAATTLSDVLYVDYHELETQHAAERTPEQWARVIMEDVSESIRESLTKAWARIELHLTPGEQGTIAGWRVTSSTPERVVLQANSALGFRGELAVTVSGDAVRFATFVATRDAKARDAWFRVVPGHLAFVRSLLERTERDTAALAGSPTE